MKKGIGILEVLIAALVLGFLIVGLTGLQKGNRESVLRIRARDVAQVVATDIIDSLKRTGLNALPPFSSDEPIEIPSFTVERFFDGATGKTSIIYSVNIRVRKDDILTSEEETGFIRAKKKADPATANELAYDFAKKIDVTVEWDFKKSPQSIQMSEVIK